MAHEFRHPKYYKELRARNKCLTRDSNADGGEGSSNKQQAQATSSEDASSKDPEATSVKQSTRLKPQATSIKP